MGREGTREDHPGALPGVIDLNPWPGATSLAAFRRRGETVDQRIGISLDPFVRRDGPPARLYHNPTEVIVQHQGIGHRIVFAVPVAVKSGADTIVYPKKAEID